MKRRDWTEARDKVESEGACRVCGSNRNLEAAHITARRFDMPAPGYRTIRVRANSVVPLCGPFGDSNACHTKYDHSELDLLPFLTRAEELQAVADLGLEGARMRTAPLAYPKVKAA